MDLKLLDGFKPDGNNTWRVNTIKKEIPIFEFIDKYTHWLIPKFILIPKEAKLTSKRLAKMIIENGMSFQEKDLFTEMLYN